MVIISGIDVGNVSAGREAYLRELAAKGGSAFVRANVESVKPVAKPKVITLLPRHEAEIQREVRNYPTAYQQKTTLPAAAVSTKSREAREKTDALSVGVPLIPAGRSGSREEQRQLIRDQTQEGTYKAAGGFFGIAGRGLKALFTSPIKTIFSPSEAGEQMGAAFGSTVGTAVAKREIREAFINREIEVSPNYARNIIRSGQTDFPADKSEEVVIALQDEVIPSTLPLASSGDREVYQDSEEYDQGFNEGAASTFDAAVDQGFNPEGNWLEKNLGISGTGLLIGAAAVVLGSAAIKRL